MRLISFSLSHIRSHTQFELSPVGPATLLLGNNGSGKSTVLESVHLLSTGTSDRAEKIQELIQFEHEVGRIKAEVVDTQVDGGGEMTNTTKKPVALEALLTRGMVGGRKTQSRLWSVNDVRRTHAKIREHSKSVLFRPEDMRLVEGSPSRRRSYINTPLSQVSHEYGRALKSYEQFLLRRNKLLTAVREREQPRSVLSYWTEGILKYGQILQDQRREYIETVNSYDLPLQYRGIYVPSLLTKERLAEYADREVAAGHTLIGPHKDDIDIAMSAFPDPVSVLTYGSRGQQRLAVLWLKMVELEFVTRRSGESPILLLDDIFSELDLDSQQIVLDMVPKQQTLLTTVEETDVGLYSWDVVRLT